MQRNSLKGSLLCLAMAGVTIMVPAQAAKNFLMITEQGNAAAEGNRNIQAKVTLNAPPSHVWQVITRYEDMDDILPGYEKSKLLSSNGPIKVLDVTMKVNPLLPRYNYQVRIQESPDNSQLNLKRISGDFKSLNVVYKLVPQNDGQQTLLIYDLSVDPGTRIPGAGVLLKSSTEKTLKALQAYIEQSHHKSVIGQR